MKIKVLILVLFAGMFTLTSCEKEEYMGPVSQTGQPLQTRGGEDLDNDSGSGSEEGITDSGHDSDYDTSNKRRRSGSSTAGN